MSVRSRRIHAVACQQCRGALDKHLVGNQIIVGEFQDIVNCKRWAPAIVGSTNWSFEHCILKALGRLTATNPTGYWANITYVQMVAPETKIPTILA